MKVVVISLKELRKQQVEVDRPRLKLASYSISALNPANQQIKHGQHGS
jgi:hypothetical protein